MFLAELDMTLRQFVSVKMSASVLHVAERLIGWEAERSNVKRVVAREIVAHALRLLQVVML